MARHTHHLIAAGGLFVWLGLGALPSTATPTALDAFQRTWERTDLPVAQSSVARTWMWGPSTTIYGRSEAYQEAPSRVREVIYYDKARMELTHPDAVDDGVWYVTNGLLVREL